MSRQSMCHVVGVLVLAATAQAAPPVVQVSQLVEREVADTVERPGRVVPREAVDVRARVDGHVAKVHVAVGDRVKKGALLVELDARPQQAEADKARAQLAVAEARLALVDKDYQRLARIATASKDEVEKAALERDVARATVQAAKAELERARLDLEFTRLVAPFDGVVTGEVVSEGNLVRPGASTSLLSLVSLDRPFIQFDLGEESILRIKRSGVKVDKLPLLVGLPGEKGFPRKATLDVVDNRVDPRSGRVRARALLAEPDKDVLPGMAVTVRIVLGPPRKALLVTDSVVLNEGDLKYLLIVGADKTVEKRQVTLGGKHGGLREVKEGLTSAEWVLVDGGRGVEVGARVDPRKVEMPQSRER